MPAEPSRCFTLAAAAIGLAVAFGRAEADDPGALLFDDRQVASVEAWMAPGDLAWLLDPENAENDAYLPARVRFRNSHLDERFEGAGIRLRGNYGRYAEKKSFKIAVDAFDDGAELCGVSKLNLIGEHNDPCIVREKLAIDALAAIGLTVSRASHVRFYLNGEYRGLYIHVEEVDRAFLGRRFGSAAGNLYKCQYVNRDAAADLVYRPAGDYEALGEPGKPVYELQTRRQPSSFLDLRELIEVINRTPDDRFVAELERVLEVSDFLKATAFDVLAGSWDDYWVGANNYFLYRDPLSGRFRFIPRDFDMTFGLNSINSVDYTQIDIYRFGRLDNRRPLIWRLLAEARYHNLFTHFIEELLRGPLAPAAFAARADELRELIRPAALADTYRTRDFPFIDYGAFDRAYDQALGGHVRHGLKPFMVARAASAALDIRTLAAPPALWASAPAWALLVPGAPIEFTVAAFDPDGIERVDLHLDTGTGFVALPMADDGAHGDGAPGDGVYGAIAPGPGPGTRVQSYVVARDRAGRTTVRPAAGAAGPVELWTLRDGPVVLNELMARNRSTIPDENGEYDDWIELWNRGPAAVNLGAYRLSDDRGDGEGWALPAIDLPPGEHLLIWADGEPAQGSRHAPFRLAGDGEWVGLLVVESGRRVAVDAVAFGPQTPDVSFARERDGELPWGERAPTPGAPNSPLDVPTEPPGPGPPRHRLALEDARPNPLHEEAVVPFEVPAAGRVVLEVVDVQGRLRRRLVGGLLPAGRHGALWDGRDGAGERVPGGVYFLRLAAGGEVRTRPLVVVR